MRKTKTQRAEDLCRRHALGMIVGAGAGAAAFVLGCGGETSEGSPAEGGSTGRGDAGLSTGQDAEVVCAVTDEGEIGPYFADDSASGFNRSNVLSNVDGSSPQSGIPLKLDITVVDTKKNCAPYANAQVDVWHCNAEGVYSDLAAESTSSETWLRGFQLTDASGKVTFETIIPGWYSGRTTHIHLRVRSSYSEASSTSDGTNTTQLFFDQTLIDAMSTSVAAYSSKGKNPTTNATDRVYSEEVDGTTLLALTGDDANGYTASVTIGLPIASNGYAAGAGPGMGG
jgi:protocatechuate 3,4-dioxygenase beta subunit